ncbi:MAG: hypothetical protein ABIS21_03040 [Acidimicrobiales bacterium]
MCLTGASWFHQEILNKNPDTKLKVYAVWEQALPTDTRSAWDDTVLDDPRVVHYWDAERLVSRALAQAEMSSQGGAHLDAYFVFGPDARWDGSPSGLLGAGRGILGRSGELKDALATVLER